MILAKKPVDLNLSGMVCTLANGLVSLFVCVCVKCAARPKNKNESNILRAGSDRTHSHTYCSHVYLILFDYGVSHRSVCLFVCVSVCVYNSLILDLAQILSATPNLYRGLSEEVASHFIFRSVPLSLYLSLTSALNLCYICFY